MLDTHDDPNCPTCGKPLQRPLDDLTRIKAERATWEIQRAEEQLEIDRLYHADRLRSARDLGKPYGWAPWLSAFCGATLVLAIIFLAEIAGR